MNDRGDITPRLITDGNRKPLIGVDFFSCSHRAAVVYQV